MEPVTLIIGALAAGAAASGKEVASQAVKDAYNGLKSIIRKQFAEKGKPEGELALKKYEEKPAVWEAPLKDSLVETGAVNSSDICNAVDILKQALEAMPEGEKILAKYNVKDCDVGIVGDNAKVEGGVHFHNHQTEDTSKLDPEAMRNAYLNRLFCDSGILNLEGIDPKAAISCDTDSGLNLGAVYTALMTHSAEAGLEDAKTMRKDEKRRLSALDALNRHKHMVLLGDPGSGKTTFVNFAACCLAGELLGTENVDLDLLTGPLPDDEGNDEEKRQKWEHGALLPVRIILRDFAARDMRGKGFGARDIWGFIQNELGKAALGEYAPYLKKELMEKGGLLFLDGLDEVPEPENQRVHIRKIVEDFKKTFHKCRILVTSRTYAYQNQDWRIPGLQEVVLAPFTSGQIRRFIDRWYRHVSELRHKDQDEARGNAELLKSAVFGNDRLMELAQRPLLLTLMASLHSWRGGSLPENREQLYADTVDLLLDGWERPKIVRDTAGKISMAQPSLMEWLKTDRTKMRRFLNELAFNAHSKQPELTGTADIDEAELVNGLWGLCKNPKGDMVKLMEFLSDRAGLLLPRGVKVYSFPHRTFQEYLAACHLTDHDYPDQVAKLSRKDPDRWREACLLAGAKAVRGSAGSIWSLAEALCHRDLKNPGTDEADLWGALLAGQALTETAILDNVNPQNQIKLDRIKQWLLRILEGNQLPAIERANAGNALSSLGDIRFDPDMWYLPAGEDMGFVKIPASGFSMGSRQDEINALKSGLPDEMTEDIKQIYCALIDSEAPQHAVKLSEYAIARYLVTVAQYSVFAEETGVDLDNDWKKDNTFDNHPVVKVDWYKATDYCKWLTGKLRGKGISYRVSLPTEAQWEKAARGKDGQIYPWGDQSIEPNRANYSDTGIGRTSPVGCFPEGISPYKALDMIGNVWEWCRDSCDWESDKGIIADTYIDDVKDPLCNKGSRRVIRGGSWIDAARLCRCAFRNRLHPGSRNNYLGFRLVLLPGQQD